MKLSYNHWLFRFWPLSNFGAISFPPFITLIATKEKETDAVLLKHEAVHWAQVDRIGAFRFYTRYLGEWIRNLFRYRFDFMRAYNEISFEKEAHERENET